MIKGKTKTGFVYEIDQDRLENYELLETISKVEKDPLLISTVTDLLLGDEQTIRLKDHVRTKKGFVPVKKLFAEIKEIMESNAPTKNS